MLHQGRTWGTEFFVQIYINPELPTMKKENVQSRVGKITEFSIIFFLQIAWKNHELAPYSLL